MQQRVRASLSLNAAGLVRYLYGLPVGIVLLAAFGLSFAIKVPMVPLHTWLPDAMAGPTPVSSLLHSSTMVVAGVFLVARVYPVFWEGMSIGDTNLNFIVLIGGITIVIAALLAFVQNDIKKVLAYSTVSQLGYMMLGLGAGAWLPAVFHIFTHAFFKACLFLAAGSVSHSGSHHSFDMKKDMGGLRKVMPIVAKYSSSNTEAYTYLADSIADWPNQSTLASWIREAGFMNVAYRNLTAGVVALHRGIKPVA